MSSESSTCIACLEAIKPGATKCPHCHQLQSAIYSPKFNSIFVTVLLAGGLSMILYILYTTISPKPEKPKPLAPTIDNERLVSTDSSRGPIVTCFGRLTNSGESRVFAYLLQANFFDGSGAKIDTLLEDLDVSLAPNGSIELRVRGGAAQAIDSYEGCSLTVLQYD